MIQGVPHGIQEVHVHLVTAISNGLTLEFYGGATDPMWGQMFKEELQIKDGFVSPPDVPGLGIELNDEALKPYRVA